MILTNNDLLCQIELAQRNHDYNKLCDLIDLSEANYFAKNIFVYLLTHSPKHFNYLACIRLKRLKSMIKCFKNDSELIELCYLHNQKINRLKTTIELLMKAGANKLKQNSVRKIILTENPDLIINFLTYFPSYLKFVIKEMIQHNLIETLYSLIIYYSDIDLNKWLSYAIENDNMKMGLFLISLGANYEVVNRTNQISLQNTVSVTNRPVSMNCSII